jgi:hypothetical protein
MFPKALGVVLIVAGVCYLVDLFAAFVAPDIYEIIHTFVIIPPIIGEVWMVIYLLVIGVKTVRPEEPTLTAE